MHFHTYGVREKAISGGHRSNKLRASLTI